MLRTWDTTFSAVKRQSVMAARLLSPVVSMNFDDIFLSLFGAKTELKRATDSSTTYRVLAVHKAIIGGDSARPVHHRVGL